MCLLMALFQAGAAAHALNVPALVSLQPGLEFVGGAFWAGAFTIGAYRLYKDAPGSIRAGGWLLVAFFGYTVARLTLFTRADYDRERLPFVWTVAGLMTVLLWLIDLRPALQRRVRGVTQQTENTS